MGFSKANFKEDEIDLIKNDCFLLAKDQSIQDAKELIYIEKDLEASSLVFSKANFKSFCFCWNDWSSLFNNW